MTDYTNTFGGAAKDAADDPLLGVDHDTELDNISTAIASKADKIIGATAGNLIEVSAAGHPVDSGVDSANFDGLTGVVQTQLDGKVSTDGVVTGHNKAGNMQFLDGDTTTDVEFATTTFTSAVTVDTWESFGPTGSGADNIWTPLDNLASNARILIVYLRVDHFNFQDTNECGIRCYATNGDDLTPAVNRQTLIYQHGNRGITGAGSSSWGRSAMVFIPLSSSQEFKFRWTRYGQTMDGEAGLLNYRGFISG